MDEGVMIAWIDEVLKPNISTAPKDIIPFLILDGYRCQEPHDGICSSNDPEAGD